ncbi:MAG: hemolysin III family protein [Desulfobacteraceae bacterium]
MISVLSLREPMNALTHMAGAAASIAGLVLLVAAAVLKAGAWHVVSFSIFGSSLVMLYTSSAFYHALNLGDKGMTRLRRLDHIMIFMLIAGTYTPICLVPLRGGLGWTLFGIVWGMAVAGTFLKLYFIHAPRWLSTSIYLVMGWLCIIAVIPLFRILEPGCMGWLAAGGVFYSLGAVVYGVKRPDPWPGCFGFHEIWHLFVMAGSFCHFWVAFAYITYI